LHGNPSHQGDRYSEKGRGFVHHLDRITTSFYFTNFPEEVKVMELWSLFRRFGRVGEVYIPKKLDKNGHRFGFVKFKEVTNALELEEKMNDVWWDSFKLRINLSRFNRGAKESKRSISTRKGEDSSNPNGDHKLHGAALVEQGRSFKHALTSEGEKKSPLCMEHGGGELIAAHQEHIVAKVNEEWWNKLQASYVGFLVDEKDAAKVSEGLVMEGYDWITATVMGGNMMLLSSLTSRSIKEAVLTNRKWWEGWFRSMLEWSTDLFMDRRSVWLRFRGVPLHAWDEPLFHQLAERFGSFIELDAKTTNRLKLDVARVKISTSSMSFIDAEISISVLDKQYNISVVEEGVKEDRVTHRGGRRVGDWVSSASSMASAAEREALVIGEALSDGNSIDRDVADDADRRFDLDNVEGGKRQFVDTRNEEQRSIGVSGNFMIHLGNNMEVGDQVDVTPSVGDQVGRNTCDGCEIQGQELMLGFLGNGPESDKWQRDNKEQKVLTSGVEIDVAIGDPTICQKGVEVEVDNEGVLVDKSIEALGPIEVGPNSFEPLGDLNPEMELEICGGADMSNSQILGQTAEKQKRCIISEGVAGLVVQDKEIVLAPLINDVGDKLVGKQTSNSVNVNVNSTSDMRRSKKKVKKGQGNMAGMPKCLQFVEAVQGCRAGGRRNKKQMNGSVTKGDEGRSVDSISSSGSSHSSNVGNSSSGDGGELLPATVVGSSTESTSDGGEANHKLLEARKIIDIQEGLGFGFSGDKNVEAQRGVVMEDFDREKIAVWERRNGDQ
jgi:hypothetical protein